MAKKYSEMKLTSGKNFSQFWEYLPKVLQNNNDSLDLAGVASAKSPFILNVLNKTLSISLGIPKDFISLIGISSLM